GRARHVEIQRRDAVGGDDEEDRGRVAHEILEERVVRTECAPHFVCCHDLAADEGRVRRVRLAHLGQQLAVPILRLYECFARRSGGGAVERRATKPWIAVARSLELSGEFRDPPPGILLASRQLARRRPRGRDTPAGQQVEHLPRPQPLACLEGRFRSSQSPLVQGEVDVHLPFIGAKRRPVLLRRNGTGYALYRLDGSTKLSRRRRQRATAAQRLRET